MKTKIILKMDRDLSKTELDYLLKSVKEQFHHYLKYLDIKTKYEILTHKGGVNVSQKSVFKSEVK